MGAVPATPDIGRALIGGGPAGTGVPFRPYRWPPPGVDEPRPKPLFGPCPALIVQQQSAQRVHVLSVLLPIRAGVTLATSRVTVASGMLQQISHASSVTPYRKSVTVTFGFASVRGY